jgi:hypothetical protein
MPAADRSASESCWQSCPIGRMKQMKASDDNLRRVREAFRPRERRDNGQFFDLVAEDVRSLVIGSTLVSGVYESSGPWC